uniref:NADPH-dependent assimilatory sulfite reductase hemoprotein subunit n=1 Tax=Schlesneria paludicola TaxID=360056 RepID=A0A7C4QSH1_9PLAN
MAEEAKRSKIEILKENSRQLRGTIAEELRNPDAPFSDDSEQLLKPHGVYQQDDRDHRRDKNPDGTPKGKMYICMVRTAVPGGKLTADQFLAHLDLCERYGNGTLRVTTRQGLQLHGVLKRNLQAAVRGINRTLLTTLAACGDVKRNVMACPAPFKNNAVRDEMQALADRIAEHLKPRTTAYHEIWLTDEQGERTDATEWQPVEEPIYGTCYLPRKFKIGLALPDDNCVDIYSHDLGFLAVVEGGGIVGYNVLVGGGMGQTPSAEKTFAALAQRMAFISPDEVLPVAEAVVKVQRDHGNRADRKLARMKYLIHNWGLEKFKAVVEDYYGRPLAAPHPADVTGIDDHIGWHAQGDGRWFLGINIENGRIKDEGPLRIKTGLRTIVHKYGMNLRLTPLQGVILCDIDPAQRDDICRLLAEHGIKQDHELTPLRRLAIACPAFPTCGLAVTESERALPAVLDGLEAELARLGLTREQLSVHMTGCPNGCARPYTPDLGFVGKTLGKYTIYVGGNVQGTRLGFIYRDLVPQADLVATVIPLLRQYKAERRDGESFGDFCTRLGRERLTPPT